MSPGWDEERIDKTIGCFRGEHAVSSQKKKKKRGRVCNLEDKLVLNGKTTVVGHSSLQHAVFVHKERVMQGKILSGTS